MPRRAVGVTVGHEGRPGPLIYVFIERADRLLRRRPHVMSRQLCLSLLLGRVIAHEMGHILLRSTAHSPEGLMRRHFDVVDGWLLPDEMYMLSPQERARVQRNLADTPPLRTHVVAPGGLQP